MKGIDLDETALEILDYILRNPSGTARQYSFAHIEKNKIALDYLVSKKALKRIGAFSVKIDENFMDVYRTLKQQIIINSQLTLTKKQTEFNKIIAITGGFVALLVILTFLKEILILPLDGWIPKVLASIGGAILGAFLVIIVPFVKKNMRP